MKAIDGFFIAFFGVLLALTVYTFCNYQMKQWNALVVSEEAMETERVVCKSVALRIDASERYARAAAYSF